VILQRRVEQVGIRKDTHGKMIVPFSIEDFLLCIPRSWIRLEVVSEGIISDAHVHYERGVELYIYLFWFSIMKNDARNKRHNPTSNAIHAILFTLQASSMPPARSPPPPPAMRSKKPFLLISLTLSSLLPVPTSPFVLASFAASSPLI
jgi:hypothetical protein